jgi:hypothetical protein
MSAPIPKTLAIVDALVDALPASETVDKLQGAIHFLRHADDALISKQDEADAEALHQKLLSDIHEFYARRATAVQQ